MSKIHIVVAPHQDKCHCSVIDLKKLMRWLAAHRKRKKVRFCYAVEVSQKKGNSMPLQLKINDEQKVNVRLVPVTPKGKPVAVQNPTWTVSDGTSTVVPSQDGMSADLISSDTPGITNIVVSADADLGDGVDTISDTIALTVTDPQATSLGLVASPPVDK